MIPAPRTGEPTTVPAPEHVLAALIGLPLEAKNLRVEGVDHLIWETNTYPHKPDQLHLEIGATCIDTYDVVLTVASIRPHPKGDPS